MIMYIKEKSQTPYENYAFETQNTKLFLVSPNPNDFFFDP
jgi:hypothetical protein